VDAKIIVTQTEEPDRTFGRSTVILGRNARAGAAVLVVPRVGAHAEDPRIARLTACGKGSGVEPVSQDAAETRAGGWADGGEISPTKEERSGPTLR
jgi:hypothetical protein